MVLPLPSNAQGSKFSPQHCQEENNPSTIVRIKKESLRIKQEHSFMNHNYVMVWLDCMPRLWSRIPSHRGGKVIMDGKAFQNDFMESRKFNESSSAYV